MMGHLKSHIIMISIHAPREGGDFVSQSTAETMTEISIHAPREGGDFLFCSCHSLDQRFQSTPPARGATGVWVGIVINRKISIHAPREGGDRLMVMFSETLKDFNPRPPRGGRP